MVERKWTPGPWSVGHHVDESDIAGHRDGYTYVKVMRFGRFEARWAKVQGGGGDADAHLIAAAPDLYDALEQALDDMEMNGLDVVDYRPALAKARGEI